VKNADQFTFATQSIFFQDTDPFDLIVVLSADTHLNRSSYRSSEQTFQMITNLLRLLKPNGQILLQSSKPNEPSIIHALSNDYQSFYESEIKARQETLYPPFNRLAKLTYAKKVEELEKPILPSSIELFGPFTGKFQYFIARGQDLTALDKLQRPWRLDTDPLSL
jgi:hypothetical protein